MYSTLLLDIAFLSRIWGSVCSLTDKMEAAFCSSAPLLTKAHSASSCKRHRGVTAVASTEESPSVTFDKDLKSILFGRVSGAARNILAQDLAKRAPEAFEDALRVRGLGGVADFARQIRDDIVPDILNNSEAYVRTATNSAQRRSSFPTNVPTPTLEEIGAEVRNVWNEVPEGLYSPPYEVIEQRNGYEVRKYSRMLLARTRMESEGGTEADNAAAMGTAFGTLATYLFGENGAKKAMSMTTPVFLEKRDSETSMAFVISEHSNLEDIPAPLGDGVELVEVDDGERRNLQWAVVQFGGYATLGEMRRQRIKLLEMLDRDGMKVAKEDAYLCGIYNGPTTLPFRRKQEMLIPVLASDNEEEVKSISAAVEEDGMKISE